MAAVSAGLGYALARGPVARRLARMVPALGTASLVFGVWYALDASTDDRPRLTRRPLASERIPSRDLPPCGCSGPGFADPATCYCGVEDILRVIRRRYSLAVMSAIHGRGTARYNEIAAALPQASSSTLAETLHALEAARLLVRHDLDGGAGPHTAYVLTPSGVKLLSRLRLLLDEVQP